QGKAKTAIDIVDGHKTATVCHLGNISVALNRQISCDPKTETFPGDEAANALARRDYRAPWTV
ncbi:MAG TPA: gfo/Idh/MocA family oxidoreductase, partial [Candidatus Hydrogenedentes bacterium]|nr:gfo/Idh/MocA family oxidoreductase [Candidatus Hydrogenedentota bacterium]